MFSKYWGVPSVDFGFWLQKVQIEHTYIWIRVKEMSWPKGTGSWPTFANETFWSGTSVCQEWKMMRLFPPVFRIQVIDQSQPWNYIHHIHYIPTILQLPSIIPFELSSVNQRWQWKVPNSQLIFPSKYIYIVDFQLPCLIARRYIPSYFHHRNPICPGFSRTWHH